LGKGDLGIGDGHLVCRSGKDRQECLSHIDPTEPRVYTGLHATLKSAANCVAMPWAVSDLMIGVSRHRMGRAVHDDRRLFEFLILEGAQAA